MVVDWRLALATLVAAQALATALAAALATALALTLAKALALALALAVALALAPSSALTLDSRCGVYLRWPAAGLGGSGIAHVGKLRLL